MMTENEGDFSIWEHLQALRNVLWRMVLTVAILFPPGWWAAGPLLNIYIAYACPPELGALNYFTPMEAFLVEMKMGLLLAFGAGFPLLAYFFWNFLSPALYAHERGWVGWNAAAGYGLFLLGAAFSLLVIVPMVMYFSAGFATERLQPMIGLGAFLELTFWLTLAFGVMFQMPLIVIGLCRLGIVKTAALRRQRPIIVVAILIVAAVLTPPDVVSQLMLAIPTLLLFEIGLWLAGRAERKREAAAPAMEDEPENDHVPEPLPAVPAAGDGDFAFYAAQGKRPRRPLRGRHRR